MGPPGGELLLGLHARGGPERRQQLRGERQHSGRGLGLGVALDDLAVDDDAGDLNADRLRLEVDVGPAQPAQLTATQTDQREMPHVSEPVLGEGVKPVTSADWSSII